MNRLLKYEKVPGIVFCLDGSFPPRTKQNNGSHSHRVNSSKKRFIYQEVRQHIYFVIDQATVLKHSNIYRGGISLKSLLTLENLQQRFRVYVQGCVF